MATKDFFRAQFEHLMRLKIRFEKVKWKKKM